MKYHLQSVTKLLTHSHFSPPISSLWSLFAFLACPFSPPHPQTMLFGNCCDREVQTNKIEWGSGVFSTVYCAIKRVMLFGTLKVLLKDNVSTNYVADCSLQYGCTLTPFPPMLGQLGCSCFLLHVHIQCILSWTVYLKMNRLQLQYHGIKLEEAKQLQLAIFLSFMITPPSAQIHPLNKSASLPLYMMTIFLTLNPTPWLTPLGF